MDLEGNHIAEGFAVARMETQNSFGATGAEEVLKFATQNNCYIGGWLDIKSGSTVLMPWTLRKTKQKRWCWLWNDNKLRFST